MFLSRCTASSKYQHVLRDTSRCCSRSFGSTMPRPERVGFVGIGNMGSGMVKNLAIKGHKVSIFDLDRPKLQAVRESVLKEHKLPPTAIEVEDSLATLASRCTTVCISLTNEAAGKTVFFGEGGLSGPSSRVKAVIDHSTVSCQFTKDCFETFKGKGMVYLDAPVSGGPEGAAKGTLSIMVGAPRYEDFEVHRPVLEAMGSFVRCMGPSGTGTVAKLINQLLTGVHIVAACEAYTLAKALGISDTSSLLQLLSRSWGNSTMLQRCGGELAKAETAGMEILSSSGAPVRNFIKDFKMIEGAAHMANLKLPLTDGARQQFELGKEKGIAEWDIAAMVKVVEKRG